MKELNPARYIVLQIRMQVLNTQNGIPDQNEAPVKCALGSSDEWSRSQPSEKGNSCYMSVGILM